MHASLDISSISSLCLLLWICKGGGQAGHARRCDVSIVNRAEQNPAQICSGTLIHCKEYFVASKACHCVQVSIDHRNGTVHFGGQQLESDRIRDHISALARRLTKALHMVQPDPSKDVENRRLKVTCLTTCTLFVLTFESTTCDCYWCPALEALLKL